MNYLLSLIVILYDILVLSLELFQSQRHTLSCSQDSEQ